MRQHLLLCLEKNEMALLTRVMIKQKQPHHTFKVKVFETVGCLMTARSTWLNASNARSSATRLAEV